jgi:PhnB protein
MTTTRKGIPDGYHTTTPYLIVSDADRAVAFYKAAFNAVELRRSVDSNGVVRNVRIRIGDSPVMLGIRADNRSVYELKVENIPLVSIYVFVEDAHALFNQAVAQGAVSLYAPEDQEYGNREGGLVDPFGITWWIATALDGISEM